MTRFVSNLRAAAFCAAALALPAAARALDLTPHATVHQGNEGPGVPVLEFTDGNKKIQWASPHDWIPDGGGKSLTLSAPGAGGAWMKLRVVPIVKEDQQPVTDPSASADDLQAWAKQFLPSGAQDVVFVKMVSSPYTVCTHPSTEYIFAYARYGAKQTISISSVDFSDSERLVVIFAADPKEFDKVRQMIVASMFNWQYM